MAKDTTEISIDLLNESIKYITPTCDTMNGNVMYACITFENGTRGHITFEQFERLAREGLVSSGNLRHFEVAKGFWGGVMDAIAVGGVLTV